MATIQCPNCHTELKKPVNVLAWIFAGLGLLSVLMIGGFLTILVCLSAVAAVGQEAAQEFETIGQHQEVTEFEAEFQRQLSQTQQ